MIDAIIIAIPILACLIICSTVLHMTRMLITPSRQDMDKGADNEY